MNFQALCFLLVMVIPGFVLMESVNNEEEEWAKCENVFEPQVNETALLNHILWLVTVKVPDICLAVCKTDDNCVSYNIAPAKEDQGWFQCELSDSDRYLAPQDFQPRPGSTYRGKRNPCLPNPCTQPKSQCERTGFDLSSRKCVCPSGLIGDSCQEDLNECAHSLSNNCTGPGVKCENLQGSYQCICEDGYVGNGTKCEKKSSWIKINVDPVCVGVQDNSYGAVVVPVDVNVKQLKLVYVSGGVSPFSNPPTAGNWGDTRLPEGLFFVVTYSNDTIIAPPPGYLNPNNLYFSIVEITVSSPELIYPTCDPPLVVKKGDQLRVWFTYDLYDYYNDGSGETCADLYIHV